MDSSFITVKMRFATSSAAQVLEELDEDDEELSAFVDLAHSEHEFRLTDQQQGQTFFLHTRHVFCNF